MSGVKKEEILLSLDPLPDGSNHVDHSKRPHSVPSPIAPRRLILDDPAEGDEAVMKPIELHKDGQEHSHGCVDEEAVQRPFERGRVVEECDVD